MEKLMLTARPTLQVVVSSADMSRQESTQVPGGWPPRGHWHSTKREHFEVPEGGLTVEVDGQAVGFLNPSETPEVPPRTA